MHFMRLRTSFLILATAVSVLGSGARAMAQLIIPNQGGPVLPIFTIYPYYYGSGWGTSIDGAAIREQQLYLANVAAYISGAYLPPGVTP